MMKFHKVLVVPDASPPPSCHAASIDWAAYGPTMDGREVDRVCKISRSKRFELISSTHPRRDPSFPPSFTLSGGRSAKRLWRTSAIAAWLESRMVLGAEEAALPLSNRISPPCASRGGVK